jgi:regulatory protein
MFYFLSGKLRLSVLIGGEKIMDSEILEAARAVASHFIGYTPRSRAEVERRLERAEFEPEVIAAVVAECEERGWIDDAELARRWVADRADRKQFGRGRLASELRRKGVDKEAVDEALSATGEEEELARARVAARTHRRPETLSGLDAATLQAERRKLAGFLQRRGFAWPIITQVLAEWKTPEE